MAASKTQWFSWCTGKLSKGCAKCVRGKKLVLFITGMCPQRCFYCPVSEHKWGHDVAYANEWKIEDPSKPTELLEEARLTGATGAGITGGDPLADLPRTLSYIKLLKKEFGKNFHIHLYTPLILVNEETLNRLHSAGLDEIRFHPDVSDDKLWGRLTLARKFKWDVGVEIPVVPGTLEKTKKLVDFISDKVDFLNLNELEVSDTVASHYKLHEMGFKPKDELSYGVIGSQEMGITLVEYAQKKSLSAHFCTAKLKDSVQVKKRLQARAQHIATRFDIKTKDGTLIRGCVYLDELKPGFGYRDNLKKAGNDMLSRVNQALAKVRNLKIECMVDSKKFRILATPAVLQDNAASIKKLGLVPAIVEEYPTADAMEVEVDFL